MLAFFSTHPLKHTHTHLFLTAPYPLLQIIFQLTLQVLRSYSPLIKTSLKNLDLSEILPRINEFFRALEPEDSAQPDESANGESVTEAAPPEAQQQHRETDTPSQLIPLHLAKRSARRRPHFVSDEPIHRLIAAAIENYPRVTNDWIASMRMQHRIPAIQTISESRCRDVVRSCEDFSLLSSAELTTLFVVFRVSNHF